LGECDFRATELFAGDHHDVAGNVVEIDPSGPFVHETHVIVHPDAVGDPSTPPLLLGECRANAAKAQARVNHQPYR
jgi:hypothetical protein